ncbi:hypothetical protein [Paraburkholderia strydomiana]|uniref:Uncharacterized protein n=1 Tax=Paraburkholderia strydomiana TaxID=1245417 RepID=A0ABW9BXN4_9BURK
MQSIPNAVNGALPGYPDYVPFLSSAMLPYDDPDFRSLVSLVGSVGAASLVGGSAATAANSGTAGGARASASSSIATAGDADLANVYSTQVQSTATNTLRVTRMTP